MKHAIPFAALLAALASGCSSGSSSSGILDAGPDGSTSNPSASGNASARPEIPGDPSSGSRASIEVTINGEKRSFTGPATWMEFQGDGQTVVSVQTNAKSESGWTLMLATFGTTPGVYTCGGSPLGGLSITNIMLPGGGTRDRPTEFGGTDTTEACTVTLASYGRRKGDHVTGTFRGELDLSRGQWPVEHLSLTDGKFDLVQSMDSP
jgi:hypothetical protein